MNLAKRMMIAKLPTCVICLKNRMYAKSKTGVLVRRVLIVLMAIVCQKNFGHKIRSAQMAATVSHVRRVLIASTVIAAMMAQERNARTAAKVVHVLTQYNVQLPIVLIGNVHPV
jgi:hypothetical protein